MAREAESVWQALEFPEYVVMRADNAKAMRTKLGDVYGTLKISMYVGGEYD